MNIRHILLPLLILTVGFAAFAFVLSPSSPLQAAPCNYGSIHQDGQCVTPVPGSIQRVVVVDPCTGVVLQVFNPNDPRPYVNGYGASFYPYLQTGATYALQPQLAAYGLGSQFVMLANGNIIPALNTLPYGIGLGTAGIGVQTVFSQSPAACVPTPVPVAPIIVQPAPVTVIQAPAAAASAPVVTIKPPNTGDGGLR